MRTSLLASSFLLGSLACFLTGCVEEVTLAESAHQGELSINESRSIDLLFLRMDVKGFTQTLTLDQIRAFPKETLEEAWLLDLDMRPLLQNVLLQLTFMPPEEAYMLPPASKNLWALLNMTPDNSVLTGTSLESLLGVGNAVGLPTSKILADLAQVGQNERLVSTESTTQAVIENIVATHPNAQMRRGLITNSHPDGLYPVAPNAIPVSLADVVTDFDGLAERYGPMGPHPGFIRSANGIKATQDDFEMTVKVNLNALPYKGVDLTSASIENVNSIASQIDYVFDFSDPDWLTVKGLVQDLKIGELSMEMHENGAFFPGGNSKDPVPVGNSEAWNTAPWELEHLLIATGFLRAKDIAPHCNTYSPQGNVPDPFDAVKVCIDKDGWTEIFVDPSVVLDTPPPSPSYFWDVLVEVAQARLHDGGLAEGQANVDLTVRDVAVGVSPDDLVAQIKSNLEKDPKAFTDVAVQLNNNSTGDPDFYYYQPGAQNDTFVQGDYLYFIAPVDIRKDAEGLLIRDYSYQNPGFFADGALTQKISSKDAIDGDTDHEKVKIEPGMTLYMEDDVGRRFTISVGNKPSPHRISLTLTRTQ